MRRTAIGLCAITTWLAIGSLAGQEPRPGAGVEPVPDEAKSPAAPKSSEGFSAEAAAARTATIDRLRGLGEAEVKTPGSAAQTKELRSIFQERLRLLTELEKTSKSRSTLENPNPSPETEASDLKAAIERDKSTLALAAKDQSVLLLEQFRTLNTSEVAMAEMNEAITKAKDAFDDAKGDLDTLTAASSRTSAPPLAAAKAEREEIRKRIAALPPRSQDLLGALSKAATPEGREQARERIVNLDWERRVEEERLRESDVRIDLETRRAALADKRIAAEKARWELAGKTLDALQVRYLQRVSHREQSLKKAAEKEQQKAAHTSNPLEKYRAQRKKEIFEEKAALNRDNAEWNATPKVSLEEQKDLANRAAEEFKRMKALVNGGRSSSLVAQRLNNSFRRLESARAALVQYDLTPISNSLTGYEKRLADVEMEQLNDERGDRALRQNVLGMLPKMQWEDAKATFANCEREHRSAIEERRRVLTDLVEREEKTRQQVLRRLQLMDDQHAYLRTHLFWVRDMEPIGLATFDEAGHEMGGLAKALVGIVADSLTKPQGAVFTTKFVLAILGLAALPFLIHRIRRILRSQMSRSIQGTL